MRSFLLSLVVAIVAMVLWAGLVFIGTLNRWGAKPLAHRERKRVHGVGQARNWCKTPWDAALRLIEKGSFTMSISPATPSTAKRCSKSPRSVNGSPLGAS